MSLRHLARYWLPALTWAAILLAASGERFSSSETGGIISSLLSLIGGSVNAVTFTVINFVIRKAGHVLAYGLLGVLFLRAIRGPLTGWTIPWSATALVLTLAVASIDEWHQSTTLTRTGSASDVALDLAGAAIALALFRWRSARQATPLAFT